MSTDTQPVPQDYAIHRWGEGYFGINGEGNVTVRPDRAGDTRVDLCRLAEEIKEAGLSLPVLVRFTDILHDRVRTLCSTFARIARELDYPGSYRAIYPVKVNQQRSVVEEILAGGDGCVGLEAGSKPELMAVLAHSSPGGAIVCNGYKDREYIRLALIGLRLGYRLYIVIEKPSELDLVLEASRSLGVAPLLGVRVRLSASANSKWQDSGGERSKFGLTPRQLLDMVKSLEDAGMLQRLELLHTHIGSQIPNLRDIRRSMGEAARYYAELRRLGAPLTVVDVGGGLGVDYEGTGTRHYCSINYTLDAYAREVLKAIGHICREQQLPCPMVFSESGRAMTAHHAMLMVNVIDSDPLPDAEELLAGAEEAPGQLKGLMAELDRLPVSEVYQEARHSLEEARELFERGEVSLEQLAQAERLFHALCAWLRPRLHPASRRHRELLDELNERLADRLFCNFSLFQSLPDVWAVEQIFPVMPLQRLNEAPERSAQLHDLTCDSDGCMLNYVDQDGVESSLPVHDLIPGEPYLLGIFMVGAYQEILGDMHNLFGDTHAINLELDGAGGYRLTQAEQGDTVDELLRYVHFSPERMLASYRIKLEQAGVHGDEADQLYAELESGLHGYTYLED